MNLSNRVLELAGGDALFSLAVKLEAQRPKVRALYHAARRRLTEGRAKKG
jgi:hypothetical protein